MKATLKLYLVTSGVALLILLAAALANPGLAFS